MSDFVDFYKQLIADKIGEKIESIDFDKPYNELGINSLNLIKILATLQKKYHFDFKFETMEKRDLSSPNSTISFLKEHF